MGIVLLGGMDRLGEQYLMEAQRHGRELHICQSGRQLCLLQNKESRSGGDTVR